MAVTHDRRLQEPVTGIAAGQRSMDVVVVRDRIELSTFRFSGRARFGIPASDRSECSRRTDVHPPRSSSLGRVRRVKAKPRTRALREP